MAKHLTDKQKKQIIANYVECQNYSQVARKYNISRNTVKAVVMSDKKIADKCQQKKEQNSVDILEYMESQKKQVCSLLDSYLSAMQDSSKIKRAGVLQLATALGIVIDKYTTTAQNDQALKKLDEVMDKIGCVI